MYSKNDSEELSQLCATRAQALVRDLSDGSLNQRGCGSMTVSHYDTAWLAMIKKPNQQDKLTGWLYPQCFEYLLQEQLPSGAWPTYHSAVDGILNSLAGLLALVKHSRDEVDGPELPNLRGIELQERISRGTRALQSMLEEWDVKSCVHVGFEILVPSLLLYLEEYYIEFDFPGRQYLFELNLRKSICFKPELLYSQNQTTALHSLEAFIGRIDFTKVGHHKVNGSLFGSPSSTAAYLMNSTKWDDDAEEYLTYIVAKAGDGAVPCAYPSTIFESTWTITTLLSCGFTTEELGLKELGNVNALLMGEREAQGGVLGFIPGVLADADDTAKSLYSLALCGYDIDDSVSVMVERFGSKDHFKTYQIESNPSFSANCNVLQAVLGTIKLHRFYTEVKKAFVERWNNSELYEIEEDLFYRVSIILYQALCRLLDSQSEDGSWGDCGSTEIASYAIIALTKSMKLPYDIRIKQRIRLGISRGCNFLRTRYSHWRESSHLWVEKVSYGSPVLNEAYCLAAIRSSSNSSEHDWQDSVHCVFSISLPKAQKLTSFYARLPILGEISEDALYSSVVGSNMYYRRLLRLRHFIFPRKDMTEDKYLEHIPLTWIGCNKLNSLNLSGQVLWDMMVLSMLNYQVDEYMETVVAQLSNPSLKVIETIIYDLCGLSSTGSRFDLKPRNYSVNSSGTPNASISSSPKSRDVSVTIEEVKTTLGNYINHILHHPRVIVSPEPTQHRLATEVCTFLLAHMRQNCDNAAITKKIYANTSSSGYFQWVRGVAADHTSCPFSFVFFCCLVSEAGKHLLSNVRQLYIGQALCRHLATLCRQYNDYGSLARDRAECNLNSLDFVEFEGSEEENGRNNSKRHAKIQTPQSLRSLSDEDEEEKAAKDDFKHAEKKGRDAMAKEGLLHIAEFERECMELSMQHLEKLMIAEDGNGKAAGYLRTFISVTDLYGQIYVAKDIASRLK